MTQTEYTREEILDMPLEGVPNLSARPRNMLSREGFDSLRDVTEFSKKELLRLDDFGPVSLSEIERLFDRYNLTFANDEVASQRRKMGILNELYAHNELRGNPNGAYRTPFKNRSDKFELERGGLIFYENSKSDRWLRQMFDGIGLTEKGLDHIWSQA